MAHEITCLNCGWVSFAVTKAEAEQSIADVNRYFMGLPEGHTDRDRRSSLDEYCCMKCRGDQFRRAIPGDAPNGCTINPAVVSDDFYRELEEGLAIERREFIAAGDTLQTSSKTKKRSRLSVMERLKIRLAADLSEIFGTKVAPADFNLYPAKGYWTHTHQDVMAWTGDVKVNDYPYTLGSWENMGDCLRFGYDISDNRNNDRTYANFIFDARGQRKSR